MTHHRFDIVISSSLKEVGIFLLFALFVSACAFAAGPGHETNGSLPHPPHPQSREPEQGPFSEKGYTFWVSQGKTGPIFHIRTPKTQTFGTYKVGPTNVDCPLWKAPKGTRLYHWGPKEMVESVAQEGGISQAEFDSDVKQEKKTGQIYRQSDGFYVSTDPVDSSMYGDHLLIDTLTRDALLIDPYVCTPSPPSHLLIGLYQRLFPSLFYRLGVMGTRHYDPYNWFLLFDGRTTSSIREATSNDLLSDEIFGTRPRVLREFLHVDATYPIAATPWLRKNYPAYAHLVQGTQLDDQDKSFLAHELACEMLDLPPSKSVDEEMKHDNSPLSEGLRKIGFLSALYGGMGTGKDDHPIPPWLRPTVDDFRAGRLHATCTYYGPGWFMDHVKRGQTYIQLPEEARSKH